MPEHSDVDDEVLAEAERQRARWRPTRVPELNHPETVTVTLPWEEAEALADHPATLQPDDPGLYWVAKVKRAVATLRAAMNDARG